MAGKKSSQATVRPARVGCGPRDGTALRGVVHDQTTTTSSSCAKTNTIAAKSDVKPQHSC